MPTASTSRRLQERAQVAAVSPGKEVHYRKAHGTRPRGLNRTVPAAIAAHQPAGDVPAGPSAPLRQTSLSNTHAAAGAAKARLPTLVPSGATINSPRTQQLQHVPAWANAPTARDDAGTEPGPARLKQLGQRKAWGAPALPRASKPTALPAPSLVSPQPIASVSSSVPLSSQASEIFEVDGRPKAERTLLGASQSQPELLPPLSQRPSTLSVCLSTSDLPLAVLAASRRASSNARAESNSASGSQRFTAGCGTAVAAGAPIQGQGFETMPEPAGASAADKHYDSVERGSQDLLQLGTSFVESRAQSEPQHESQRQQQQQPLPDAAHAPVQLDSSDLAVLRESMIELQLELPASQSCDTGSAANAAAAMTCGSAIPDAVVLQELCSRLGRLDSQKRRVLIAVLHKIDGLLGEEDSAPGSDPGALASQLLKLQQQQEQGCQQTRTSSQAGDPAEPREAGAQAAALRSAPTARDKPGKLARLRSIGRSPSKGGSNGLATAQDSSISAEASIEGRRPSSKGDTASRLQRRRQERPRMSLCAPVPEHEAAQQEEDALTSFEQAEGRLGLLAQQPVAAALASEPEQQAPDNWQQPDALDTVLASTAAAVADAHVVLTARPTAGAPAATMAHGSGCGGGRDSFCIPLLPRGSVLQIAILSTHGDQHFVGLCGIEMYDVQGQLVQVPDPGAQVTADPHSINVLPEYGSDPRTPDKLLDGVYLTCDDVHQWLAPFTPGRRHTVTVTLESPVTLGALRIWNYNKSRIHSLRGARQVDVLLDGQLVFTGELRQAAGIATADALKHAELLLFTDSPAALAALEQRDQQLLHQLQFASLHATGVRSRSGSGSRQGSPVAAALVPEDSLDLVTALPSGRQHHAGRHVQVAADGRPFTAPLPSLGIAGQHAQPASSSASSLLWCSELTLVILSSWADSHFVGLAGLEVLGADGQPLPLRPDCLWASPPDLNAFPGHSGDCRTLDKLLDGTCNTTDDAHMWLAPMRRHLGPAAPVGTGASAAGASPAAATAALMAATAAAEALPTPLRQHNVLGIQLSAAAPISSGGSDFRGSGSPGSGFAGSSPTLVAVTGLRVWNYNKNPQDTGRGAKRVIVLADGVEVSPPGGLLVRRAPGTAAFDFAQVLAVDTTWCSSRGSSRSGSAGSAGRVSAAGSWLAPASASGTPGPLSRRASLVQPQPPQQLTGRGSPWPGRGPTPSLGAGYKQQQSASPQRLQLWDESTAWVCNLPDPLAAAAYLQNCSAWRRAGTLLTQLAADWFAAPLPCGFSLKLAILSSQGDPQFVGLCGLEVVDAVRGPLGLRPSQVHAVPSSVASLPDMQADVRTPDKLVDGVTTGSPAHSWLAPLIGGRSGTEQWASNRSSCAGIPDSEASGAVVGPGACCNLVHLTLDTPVLLSALRVWNYARRPARGVQEVEVYLDEQLIWKGLLQRAPDSVAPGQDFSQLLCFSEEACAAAQRRSTTRADSSTADAVTGWLGNDVTLVNDGQFVGGRSSSSRSDTDAAALKRPTTAVVC